MKAVTLRQPYASLVAADVKTIITRPRPTKYRGRVAIHAAQKAYILSEVPVTDAERALPQSLLDVRGAVVASAVLTDCAPILNVFGTEHEPGPWLEVGHGGSYLSFWAGPRSCNAERMDDQIPFGDFSPGRWALLLDDIAPTTERCPWCWGIGNTSGRAYVVGPGWDETSRVLRCEMCGGAGRCDPVPARGQQAVPWEWEP